MIPLITMAFNRLGIPLAYQAAFEQTVFWGANMAIVALTGLGSFWSAVAVWGVFAGLHAFFRSKTLRSPPKSIAGIAAMNFVFSANSPPLKTLLHFDI